MTATNAAAFVIASSVVALLVDRHAALAHCDTMDGPVVTAAKAALSARDVTPVLKWVPREREEEIRAAFRHALAVRGLGDDARSLADRYFFETLVRVHRAGEGEPYDGLKPAGADADPAVREADRALESGSPEALIRLIGARVEASLREGFRKAAETRAGAETSVDAGRESVAAYVRFVHLAKAILSAAEGDGAAPGDRAGHGAGSPRGAHAREESGAPRETH